MILSGLMTCGVCGRSQWKEIPHAGSWRFLLISSPEGILTAFGGEITPHLSKAGAVKVVSAHVCPTHTIAEAVEALRGGLNGARLETPGRLEIAV